MEMKKQKNIAFYYILLHILLLLFSFSGVCSKFAGRQDFFSIRWILLYGTSLFILFLYSIFWQQILKALPLVSAYANRAITVVWGIIWGYLIFGEKITVGKVIGAILVLAGIVLFAKGGEE